MSLSLALNNALSGLNVNQRSLAVLSHNIANANTEGYSRQVLEQSQLILDGQGSGVRIDDIVRKIDKYLDRSIQRETSTVGEADRIADYFQRVQILMGEPGQDNSIDEYIETFFNSLQALAETPERVSFQTAAVSTADILAKEISGLARSLEDLRYQADQDITEAVDYINNELAHLDTLNIAINRAYGLGTSTAGLLDQRDMALENISEYLDIEVYFEESGSVKVYTGNGIGLVDEDIHRLSYRPMSGIDAFIVDDATSPLQVESLDDDGNIIRAPENLFSGGVEGDVVSLLEGGALQGLHRLRDEILPEFLGQLDMLASRLRDQINAIHNDGAGFPPADELTGTRFLAADQAYDWSGSVRIAVLSPDGTPAYSTYADENYTGYRPLTLDLTFLNSGQGAGTPTVQTIIDEINNHFNAPPVKAEVNNLNNIQLVSDNTRLPLGAPPLFTFDLDLENISATEGELWITNVRVFDDTAADISAGGITDTLPKFAVDTVNSYGFQAGSDVMTITTTAAHTFQVGERVYIEDPGGLPGTLPVSGIPSSLVSGYFEIVGTPNANQFQVKVGQNATGTGTDASGAAFNALPPYYEIAAGEKHRTRDAGTVTTNLSLNGGSTYYDIQMDVGVYNNDPDNPSTDLVTLTYRVYNNNTNLLNDRYDIMNLTGNGQRVFPTTPHQYIFARMVDADGNELPQTNGSYGSQEGYLQLVSNDLDGREFVIAIDEMDSKQLGQLSNSNPPIKGTNRAFSHFFELNNFFVSNNPTEQGDAVSGSAINMAVSQRILDNPSLISTGDLELSNQPVGSGALPLYTYERYIGDNSIAQRLAKLGTESISFDASGGIPASTLSFNGYAGELLGYVATRTVAAENTLNDGQILLNGFINRADAISGVNLDEELANTIIFQNAYTANARVISVTDELFGELLGILN